MQTRVQRCSTLHRVAERCTAVVAADSWLGPMAVEEYELFLLELLSRGWFRLSDYSSRPLAACALLRIDSSRYDRPDSGAYLPHVRTQ